MYQAAWVIKVLDDSKNRRIEEQNRSWLRCNVNELNIKVCVEDCNVNSKDVVEECKKEDTILVQEGKIVQNKSNFNPEKEALLLLERDYGYVVFQYFPEE